MKNLLLLFCLTSCAYMRTQSTKMLSPEAQGQLGRGQVELRLEAQKRDELDFANDQTNNAIDRAQTLYAAAPMGEVGLFKRFDVYIQPHFNSPFVVGGKYQFLGDVKKEAAKGNFSTSVILGFGSYSKSASSDGDLSFLADNIKEIEMQMSHTEVGIISGYRWFDPFLQYINIIYQREELTGKVTKKSGPLQKAPFKYKQDGMIYSTGFIHYFGKYHWKLDYSYFVSDWSRTQKQTVNSVSGAIGLDW